MPSFDCKELSDDGIEDFPSSDDDATRTNKNIVDKENCVAGIHKLDDVFETTLSTSTVTGNTLKWYSVSTGGSSLSSIIPSTSTSGVTSYFVSQTNNDNCESPRSEISVTVNTIPLAPVVSPTISYCKGATAIPLNATATSGNTLRWYTVISGGTPLPGVPTPSTATVGDTTYYVSQLSSATGCESARASVVVTVKAIPSIPAFTSSVTLCQFSSAPT
jgi:hypothetical protein